MAVQLLTGAGNGNGAWLEYEGGPGTAIATGTYDGATVTIEARRIGSSDVAKLRNSDSTEPELFYVENIGRVELRGVVASGGGSVSVGLVILRGREQ